MLLVQVFDQSWSTPIPMLLSLVLFLSAPEIRLLVSINLNYLKENAKHATHIHAPLRKPTPYQNPHQETRNSYGIPKALNAATPTNFHRMRAPLSQFHSAAGGGTYLPHNRHPPNIHLIKLPPPPPSHFLSLPHALAFQQKRVSFWWCLGIDKVSAHQLPVAPRRPHCAAAVSLDSLIAATTAGASHVLYAVGGWFAVVPVPVWWLERKWWWFRDGVREGAAGLVVQPIDVVWCSAGGGGGRWTMGARGKRNLFLY